MGVVIKVTPLLIGCSVFSTVVSFAGGLVLYLESIKTVEETVEEIAVSESEAVTLILRQAIQETKKAADRLASLLDAWHPFKTTLDIVEWHTSDAFSLINSTSLYGTGLTIIFNYTKHNADDNISISGLRNAIWWDPLTDPDWIKSNGGDRYYAASYTDGSKKGIPCLEGEDTAQADYCIAALRVDAVTGKISELAYNYTGLDVFETWLPGGESLQSLWGWQQQRVSQWLKAQSWISP
eukprot:Hpha_TRINITY_DN16937_c0_g2::TRINITY_DN16937_c0_g2_i1::g.53038::m.53038